MKSLLIVVIATALVCPLASADERTNEPWPDLLAKKEAQQQSGYCVLDKDRAVQGFVESEGNFVTFPKANIRFVHCALDTESRQVILAEKKPSGEIEVTWVAQ